MSARIRVPVDQLREKWMDPDAVGLANNLKLGVRIVTMADGTQYETPLAEVSAALKVEEEADAAAYAAHEAEAAAGLAAEQDIAPTAPIDFSFNVLPGGES